MSSHKTAHNIEEKPRTGDVLIDEVVDFPGLLLSPPVLQGLQKAGFARPSPIQLKAIPLGRCGLDLIVQAKSGTGKTCVFTVVALESLLLDTVATQVVVLAPTREIVVQIWEVITSIGSCLPKLRCYTFIGGMPISDDKQKLKKCHIAVGTPGRMKQLIEEQALRTENVRIFVLDEADKLMDESFQEQINWIYSAMPDNKQMLALSATYPEVLVTHLTAYMRNPTFVRLNTTDPALLGIRQYLCQVPFHPVPQKQFDLKANALIELLSSINFHQCLVFSNYQMRAQNLSDILNAKGWPAAYISGSQEQVERLAAMAKLKQVACRVLISTDLTSRGIDAEHVNLVVNLDIPRDNETYLHRIGRAGRFGTYGAGVTFAAPGKELEDLRRIEAVCNTSIKKLPEPPPVDLTRSSGFISLDHLVTTETIITRDGQNQYVPLKIDCNANQDTTTSSSNATETQSLKELVDHSEAVCDTNVIPPTEKASKENISSVGESSVDSTVVTDEASGTHHENCKDLKQGIVCNSTKVVVPEDGLLVSRDEVKPDEAIPTPISKPKHKVNNIWTSLSFSYRDECKAIEQKRNNPKPCRSGRLSQSENSSTGAESVETKDPIKQVKLAEAHLLTDRSSSHPVLDTEGSLSAFPTAALESSTSLSPGTSKMGKPDKEKWSVADKTVAMDIKVPSLASLRGSTSKATTVSFRDILADYETFVQRGDCDEQVCLTQTEKVSVELTRSQQGYQSYVADVARILEDLASTKDMKLEVTSVAHEDSTPRISVVLDTLQEKASCEEELPLVVNHLEQMSQTESEIKSNKPKSSAEKSKTMTQLTRSEPENTSKLRNVEVNTQQTHMQKEQLQIVPSRGKATKRETFGQEKNKLYTKAIENVYGKWTPCKPEGNSFEKQDASSEDDSEREIFGNFYPRDTSKNATERLEGRQHAVEVTRHHSNKATTREDDREIQDSNWWSGISHPANQWHDAGHNKERKTDKERKTNQNHHGDNRQEKLRKKRDAGYAGYGGNSPEGNVDSDWSRGYWEGVAASQSAHFTDVCHQQYWLHSTYASYYKQLLDSQQEQQQLRHILKTQQNYVRSMAKWMARQNLKP